VSEVSDLGQSLSTRARWPLVIYFLRFVANGSMAMTLWQERSMVELEVWW
jgi:hypothetical protein